MGRPDHCIQPLERRMYLAAEPPVILFIRGADRSGGFLEAGSDAQRTEQLADIHNQSTGPGNHGWFQLAEALRLAGFDAVQITESVEPGAPPTGPTDGVAVDFSQLDLSLYSAIVFGSNNAVYDTPGIDAIESYIRDLGGAALFISDANFGFDWADASDSDQHFLDRFGLTVNQDYGTYAVQRSLGDFVAPEHPIFENVNAFDGEGVSPLFISDANVPGVDAQLLARAKGQTRVNAPPYVNVNTRQGALRPTDDGDASLLIARADDGRIAGHYDRNTFFNQNGAGTFLSRFDNLQYALNLFGWLTFGDPNPAPPTVVSGEFFVDRPTPEIAIRFDENVVASLDAADLVLQNLSTNVTVPANSVYWAAGNRGVFRLDPETLDDGHYRATLPASAVTDASGNPLHADFTFEFSFLNGDANRDGVVNLADFNILAANFGQSPRTFTDGDFNYDGIVNLDDFNILASRFGVILGSTTTSASLFADADDDRRPPVDDAGAGSELV